MKIQWKWGCNVCTATGEANNKPHGQALIHRHWGSRQAQDERHQAWKDVRGQVWKEER